MILGATGMLGNAMMRVLPESANLETWGTVRSQDSIRLLPGSIASRLVVAPDVLDAGAMEKILEKIRPDVVINCVAPPRAALRGGEPLSIIPICAVFPHQLAASCERMGVRLVHISTDAVFSGMKGGYTESDPPDANDVYGLAKRLGEPVGAHTVTIRASMIGHERRGGDGLLEWFLSQNSRCKCFERAVFSGLPTVVLAQIVRDLVLPHPELSGVYHVAAEPITKCDLLRLIARIYGKEIEIVNDTGQVIDRSLNSDRFRRATGYVAPDWETLIRTMHSLNNGDQQ